MRAPTGERPLILVAEDDELTQELIVIVLEMAGYEVVLVNDGQAALDAAQSRSPDLVLLDVMMPGIDGYEATRRLRAHPSTCEVPIVLLTLRSLADDLALGYEAGADDYLAKPFSGKELRARIGALLERDRAGAAM